VVRLVCRGQLILSAHYYYCDLTPYIRSRALKRVKFAGGGIVYYSVRTIPKPKLPRVPRWGNAANSVIKSVPCNCTVTLPPLFGGNLHLEYNRIRYVGRVDAD
jgi:hypothetical protein